MRRLAPLFVLIIFGAALWALYRDFRHVQWRQLSSYVTGLPSARILLAALAGVLSYGCLAACDFLGTRYVRQTLKFGTVALVSFISYAFSMNLGAAVVSGGAVRLRLYSGLGLRTAEVARLIGFCAVVGICGQALVSGLAFTFWPLAIPATVPFPMHSTWPLGLALLLGLTLVWALSWRGRPVLFRAWRIEIPSFKLTTAATLASAFDWVFAAVAVIALLPAIPGVSAFQVAEIILLAHFAGMLSTVPGGLGVFEYVVIALLPPTAPHAEVLGGLVAYRAIYYLIPFSAAITLLGWREWLRQKPGTRAVTRPIMRALSAVAPLAVSVSVTVAGVVLMVSGSTPAAPGRMAWLREVVPLTVVETSHFFGSLAGLFLVVLGWSLHRRVRTAWYLAVSALVSGIFFSLLKGADWEEALVLAIVLALILPARRRYTREAALLAVPFTARWWGVIALALVGVTWLGFFAFKHVEYSSELWWQFSYGGHASRFLRAAAGMCAVLAALAVAQLLSPSLRPHAPENAQPDEGIARIIAASTNPEAGLAWLGDKQFLRSRDGRAFIMHGVQGQSLIALGDPVGPEEAWDELLWDFRDDAHRRGARPVFYQVGEAGAHRYVDLGLQLYKMGEEGRVALEGFGLEGSARKELRNVVKRGQREGCVVEVLPAGASNEWLPELRAISEAWLGGKNAREKRFSLGSFKPEYLARFPLALVRRDGEVVAFSNLFCGADRSGLSVDLMRYHPERSINGTMPYLFSELMLWGKEQGYGWFSLGISPLSGLARRPLAPVWHRVGAALFTHGEHFYNFQGLRGFKEKFLPQWSGVYLATVGALSLPKALVDCAALISGSVSGIVRK